MSFLLAIPSRASSKAQKEFIQVAGIADFDPKAKARHRAPRGDEARIPGERQGPGV
jgi:hypothetical protein